MSPVRAADPPQPVQLGPALAVKIEAQWPDLSEKERAVAAFLLQDPKTFIAMSISAIAAQCGVSETVIIRLYRKLGYEGFHQFKIDIAQSLASGGYAPLAEIEAGDGMEAIKQKVFANARQALEEGAAAVDSGALLRLRDAVLAARRVVLVAFGGSAPVAQDLAHKLLKLGIVAVPLVDSHLQIMAASVLGPGDLLIAISHSGHSRDVVEALQQARRAGAATAAITGIPSSPVARAADVAICTPCRETQYQTDAMNSRYVQLAVVDTLYVSLILARKEEGLAAIRETSLAAARKKL